eukprot:RCo049646
MQMHPHRAVQVCGYRIQSSKSYDPLYALRLCLDSKNLLACSHVYKRMRMFEDAVSAALRIGMLTLAISYANSQGAKDSDPELRRRLWLQILAHVLRGDGPGPGSAMTVEGTAPAHRAVVQAMELLVKEADSAISLEDVL